jgi:hypothetical protein
MEPLSIGWSYALGIDVNPLILAGTMKTGINHPIENVVLPTTLGLFAWVA